MYNRAIEGRLSPTSLAWQGRTIRKLLTSEVGAVERHLLRLSPEDRALRFFGAVSDEFIGEHVNVLRGDGSILVGCFIGGELRGVAELHPPVGDRGAEMAVTVEAAFQGRGLGTALFETLVNIARNRGIGALHCACLADNTRMQSIVRKLGGVLHYVQHTVEADFTSAGPSPRSLFSEAFANGQTVLHAAWRVGAAAGLTPFGLDAVPDCSREIDAVEALHGLNAGG
jgi:GNAT superfamily N-acetyltransferase